MKNIVFRNKIYRITSINVDESKEANILFLPLPRGLMSKIIRRIILSNVIFVHRAY